MKAKILNFIPKNSKIIAIFDNKTYSVAVFYHSTEKHKVYSVSYTSPISLDANHHFFTTEENAINEYSRIINIILKNK